MVTESTVPLQEVAAVAVENNRTNVTISLFSRDVTGHVGDVVKYDDTNILVLSSNLG